MRHVFDRREVGGRVVGSHAALVVAKHHVHHPVQAVLDGPVAAHDGADQGRDHDQGREIKPCLMLGFSVDLTAAFDHDHGLQPRPLMPFLKPLDVIYNGCGASFDTAVIAVDRLMAADLGILKAVGFLLGREKLDILAQRLLNTRPASGEADAETVNAYIHRGPEGGLDYCIGNQFAGRSDWRRLDSLDEAVAVIDTWLDGYSRRQAAPSPPAPH